MDRRIIRIHSGYTLNNFIKLNSSLFDHPDHFEFVKTLVSPIPPTLRIFSEALKFSNTRHMREILKERDGDNLGFQIFIILKEGMGFNLGDGKFSDFENGGFP